MNDRQRLWEYQETPTIVAELLNRLRSGGAAESYDTTLLDPLREAIQTDLEEHPRHGDDLQLDARVDRVIAARPDIYFAFQQFVEDAFLAGPNGDGQQQHFSITTSPLMRPTPQ
jgi:hypothetical protein